MHLLHAELERRVELLQILDDDKLPTAKSTSTYGPSPLSAAAPVPVSGSKTTQGSHTTTTAQPASITSQGSNQQHHVLVACLAAGGGLAFTGAVLYAFITLRRKRQRAGQGVYVVKDGSAPLPTTHAYLLHTSLGGSMNGPWAGALQEMQAAAHQLNESLDLGSNVLKPPGAPYKQPAKELAPKGFLNFRAFGSGLWVWPEQGGAVRTATSSARRGPKSIASPEFVISPQSQGYDLGQLQLGSVLTCSANSAVYVGHWRLLPVAVKVRRVCIDDPPSGKSPHTASAAAVKAGQQARCDTKAWREGRPFLRVRTIKGGC